MSVENAYLYLYMAVLIWFALLITVGLIRAIIGPRITDRVLSINMISTMVISCIAILSVQLAESYLVDVALIYAMISFVSVLILISIYLPGRTLRSKELSDGEEESISKVVSDGTERSGKKSKGAGKQKKAKKRKQKG